MAKSYVELSSNLYSSLVDAMGAANQRTLNYGKSVYEIASRPYTSTAVDAALRENFDRMNQIVETTVAEVQQNGRHATDFVQQLLEHGAAVQETLVETGRTMATMSASNMAFVKESAEAQAETFSKTVNDMQARAASVSAN
jgi:hypothetical protein